VGLCEQGSASGPELAPFAETVLAICQPVFEAVRACLRDVVEVEWLLDDEYEPGRARAVAARLVGLHPRRSGHSGASRGAFAHRSAPEAVRSGFPVARYQPVDTEEIEAVAASGEVRETLWRKLTALGLRSLMPARWATLQALAASALTRWLAHPNELNAIPEQVDLMNVFPVELDGRTLEVYLFRFREFPKPWEPGKGWMAAVAGPYRDGMPLASPWSSFTRWDAQTPADQFHSLCFRC
jgi:hypothetical protein